MAEEKPSAQTPWRIVDAEFEKSVMSLSELPFDGLAEIAFVGRSNAGKSSLLNAICNRKSLARVSKTPGRTQAINMFMVRLRNDSLAEDKLLRFADLPGYGYAKVARGVREQWREMLGEYLQSRDLLSAIVLVHDIRRKLSSDEEWFLDFCEASCILVLNKSDKLSRSEVAKAKRSAQKTLELTSDGVVTMSSTQGRSTQIDTLVSRIVQYAESGA